MIEDVYEPLAKYRDEFREAFAKRTVEKFRELTVRSGVDVEANRRLVARVRTLEGKVRRLGLRRLLLGLLAGGCLVGVVAALVWVSRRDWKMDDIPAFPALVAAGAALGFFAFVRRRRVDAAYRALSEELEAQRKAAWGQMEPLNRLYTWDIPVKLIEATVPRLAFDPYFTVDRLAALRTRFGWDDGFNVGKSVIFAQSGVINGNPFVFGQYLEMTWGERTYTGTKEISWMEWETDASGRRRRVRRYETLVAEVSKPIPEYAERKILIYGNDAAGALSFTHQPSGLRGACDGFFARLRKRWRLRRLKAYSRNLKDDSNFTLMNNHEFEAWFHAKDRDNEVEFRLLFTPIAQRQMLELMKDDKVGYGDDFMFAKRRKVNMLSSVHLDRAVIDTDPARFRHWAYDEARENFIRFNERYFKDAYFSLAPVLAIPLYQQTRTHEDIWSGVLGRREASFWEHESIANYYGEDRFRHPDSITRSILKTEVVERADGEGAVAVTAYGYRGVGRVEHRKVFGGDGRLHDVAVEWTEYVPVHRTSTMCVSERESPSERFSQRISSAQTSAHRRSIASYLAG